MDKKEKIIEKLKELNQKQEDLISIFMDEERRHNYRGNLLSIEKFKSELATLESQLEKKEEHITCDGCQMFQDCGCMLDVSVCPDCFEHDQWTPKK